MTIINRQNIKTANLTHIVKIFLKKKKAILKSIRMHQTPFYLFDKGQLIHDLDVFRKVFSQKMPGFKPFYALKINHYEKIVEETIKHGYGLDVASGKELNMALHYSCNDILFYSPGKSDEELELAVKNNQRVRINIDSFDELEKIGHLTNKLKSRIGVGIRIHLRSMPQWVKFGIDIDDLHKFWQKARKYPYVNLGGIHFHASRNKNSEAYVLSVKELGNYLTKHFSKSDLESIKYIDFGGGFEPYASEGYYPYEFSQDATVNSDSSYDDVKKRFSSIYKIREALPLAEYANQISAALQKYLVPHLNVQYYAEPGRIICNNAMHIVLSVRDIKDNKVCILDGGINMVGWQRYMYEYFPLINLTHPALREIAYTLYGRLCTTRDIWGYTCYAAKIKRGDIILVPNQGALTYSIAQNWIMPVPKVFGLYEKLP